ncbi:hypothetical protein FB451DRAFT_1128035 [Mycena latifolia]|nr:hypothetical protein FB451DRAFT_1128035 [Mycena latifolia]
MSAQDPEQLLYMSRFGVIEALEGLRGADEHPAPDSDTVCAAAASEHELDAESSPGPTSPGPSPENDALDAAAVPRLKDVPEFIRKLYNILEDPEHRDTVSWGPRGDCLRVKDVDEFTKSLLPRTFKHSNFASFVRQLNKYGFRKIRLSDGCLGGAPSWVFRHPDFRAGRPAALRNIKRKNAMLPAAAPPFAPCSASGAPADSETIHSLPAQLSVLHGQLKSLSAAEEGVLSYVRNLESSYKAVLEEMIGFRRYLAQLDGVLRALVPPVPPENSPSGGWFAPRGRTAQLTSSPITQGHSEWVAPSDERAAPRIQDRPAHAGAHDGACAPFADAAGGCPAQEQVVPQPQTAGPDLVCVEEEEEEEMVMPTLANPQNLDVDALALTAGLIPRGCSGGVGSPETSSLRVRRWSLLPGWAVPPRVLLVDDDAVIRQLSSRLLQLFGCTIDVAVDGVGAVAKMNLEKYDLVLMDIAMPKMDGVSATALIRNFDALTPIISMTSSSRPTEIMSYYSSGMNDILPKPFTKEGLLEILEKHLAHLLMMQQQMSAAMCVRPAPLLDDAVGFALQPDIGMSADGTLGGAGLAGPDAVDGSIDALRIGDDGYTTLLAGIFADATVGAAPQKRALDLDLSDSADLEGRVCKRGRFEGDE